MKGKKASGGRTKMVVSGNPDVLKEANSKGTSRNTGGRIAKRKTGGKVDVGFMTGGAVRPRLDKPGRKSGGRVGADKSPLSTAHGGSMSADGSSNPKDTYGGLQPD